MNEQQQRRRSLIRAALTLIVATALYEGVSYSGLFPRVLLPNVQTIATTLYGMLADGSMFEHAGATLFRVLMGFALATSVGVTESCAILSGRSHTRIP